MPRRRVWTNESIRNSPRSRRQFEPVGDLPGFFVRNRSPKTPRTYVARGTNPITHRKDQVTFGCIDVLDYGETYERARAALNRIAAGLRGKEPRPTLPDSVADILNRWFDRKGRKLRTAAEYRRLIDKVIVPRIDTRPFAGLKRSEIVVFLDAVERDHGAWTADHVLSALKSIGNWYRDYDDNYTSPFAGIKPRVPKSDRARDRVLTDPELREFWRATEDEAEEFHAILRLCLLTGSRVGKVKDLHWDDVNFTTGAWTIRTEKGEKSNARRLVLPSFTLRIIESRPRLASSPYVFIRRIRSHGYLKKNFDRHCLIQTRWSVHDLRRTARTLLSRCGVQSEIAERVLGHTVGGIQSVYDHHPFDVERAHALRQLAQLVETIVTGPHDNVVPLRGAVS